MHIGRSKYIPLGLILGFAIITLSRSSFTTPFRAQLSPGETGIIPWQDFAYEGAFLVSSNGAGSSRFSYSWGNMAADPTGNNGLGSLYLSGHLYDDKVAEVNIPTPMVLAPGTSRAELPRTSILQQFADVTSGYFAEFQQENNNSELSGLAVMQPPGFPEKQLFWTTRIYYNVWGGNPPSHGVASTNLSAPNAQGPWLVQGGHNMLAGFLAPVPQDFADTHLHGSSLLTGQSGVAGNAGSSFGPVAFAIKPWMENGTYQPDTASIPSTPLVYYPIDKPYPGFDSASRIEGMAWVTINGKHALAFIGTIGTGHYWYGEGSDAGYTDPCSQSKGQHNSSFETRLYLYGADELLKVVNGTLNPWDARPYEVINMAPYLNGQCSGPHAMTYDPVHHRLFIFESHGYIAPNEYEYAPAVHSFILSETPAPANEPPPIASSSNTATLPPPTPLSKRSTGVLVKIGGNTDSREAYFHTKENLRSGKVAVHRQSAPADLHLMECAPDTPITAAEIFSDLGEGDGNAWGYQYKDKDAAYETNCVKNALNATPPRSIDECFLGPDAGKFIGRADGFPFVDPSATLSVPAGEPYALFVTSMNVVSPSGERFARCTKPTAPECGDGFREGSEPCDDGNTANRDACLVTCAVNVPGDGFPLRSVPAAEPGEPCDDGNTANGDGCTSLGVTETLYVCQWNEVSQKDNCSIPLGGAPGG